MTEITMTDEAVKQTIFDTPVGSIVLSVSEKGLKNLSILNNKSEQYFPHNSGLDTYIKQITEYFDGARTIFDLPLDMDGTSFQKAVWDAAVRIPYGETAYYQDIAEMIGSPLAVRAVGTALKMNPVCIVIPCHRILPKSGGSGHYAYGTEKKEWLLRHEKQLR